MSLNNDTSFLLAKKGYIVENYTEKIFIFNKEIKEIIKISKKLKWKNSQILVSKKNSYINEKWVEKIAIFKTPNNSKFITKILNLK